MNSFEILRENSFPFDLSQISMRSLTIIVTGTVTTIAVVLVFYAHWVFTVWDENIGGHRLTRISEDSPSNKQPPNTRSFSVVQSTIIAYAELHEAYSKCELVADVKDKRKNWRETAVLRDRAKAVPFLGAMDGEVKADALNMDHVYIRYLDFLWGHIFIGPCSYLLWVKGTFILRARMFLIKHGLLKYKECESIEILVGKFCLELSQVINYFAKTKEGSKLGNVAGFFFPNFPYVDNDMNYKVADLFSVDIDLDTKKFVKAKLDNTDVTAMQAAILLYFNGISAQHVKLHAGANWGTNDHPSLKQLNPFLQQNSVVTAIYNYFGYSAFSGFLKTWEKQGLLSDGWSKKGPFLKVINHGIKDGIAHHGNITDLMPHSRFVYFIVKVRAIFMAQFALHKHLFPGIDGESFFVGTVLHSLDHCLLEWNLEDPLWLDTNDPKFGVMAELCRIVRVGFVQDVPFLYFNRRFKGSDHPFYKNVYEKAAKIDQKFADNMDTCIIK